jgi:hypothetical protein
MPTFIETQFPIVRLFAESYKERKANNRQILILVQASILGMLMPPPATPKKTVRFSSRF